MRKLYIGEIEFEEFMDSQVPLDPEFQQVINDNLWRLYTETEEEKPKQLDMFMDL